MNNKIPEIKNTLEDKILELKTTLEGITSRLDDADNQISELGGKVQKKHPERARKGKKMQKE